MSLLSPLSPLWTGSITTRIASPPAAITCSIPTAIPFPSVSIMLSFVRAIRGRNFLFLKRRWPLPTHDRRRVPIGLLHGGVHHYRAAIPGGISTQVVAASAFYRYLQLARPAARRQHRNLRCCFPV